jgi:hypothetical protein
MTQIVAPGADYASRLSAGIGNSGLAGTVRFRLLDSDPTVDDPVYGPSTANIVEDPTGSGDYLFTAGVAPSTTGKYYPAWDLGSGQLYYDDDLVVSYTAQGATEPSGRDLCTLEDVVSYAPGYTIGDDETLEGKLQQLITAQSDLICSDTGREIPNAAAVDPRIYDTGRVNAYTGRVDIDDLTFLDDRVTVELYDADGSLAEEIDVDTIIPLYGAARHTTNLWEPITALEFRTSRGAPSLFPGQELRITGTWGFPSIPTFIREACAARVVLRYVSDVAASGDQFSEAVSEGNLNLAGLFASSADAIGQLQRPVFA